MVKRTSLQPLLALACAALLLVPLWSAAEDDASGQLLAALGEVKSLRGSFVQRQYSADGELVEQSRGSFRLLRPGYFAWQIDAPDRQLIIADPEFLWHHDIELETVTRRPVNGNDAGTPLQILGGDEDSLRDNYTVAEPAAGKFTLTPKQPGAAFRELELTLAAGRLAGMKIRDNTGQTVDIAFDNLDTTALAPADFLFVPPEGADLFYYDQ